MPHEYRIDTLREELKSEYRDEIRELKEDKEDDLPDWAYGEPSLEDKMDLEQILWANFESEEGLEPEFEDVLVWIEELIAIDKFIWKF